MFTQLKLIEIQRFNYVIFTICAILFLISSSLESFIERKSLQGIDITFKPTPAQITAFTYWILTGRNLSAAFVDTARLYQRKLEVASGESQRSIIPNIRIFIGSWLLFFAALSIAIGAQERVEEDAEIVII